MRKKTVKQKLENSSLEPALEALRKSIALWTDDGEQPITAISGLSLY